MKRMIVIFLALLLCLVSALAEDGAGIEVLRLDGVPVAVLYLSQPDEEASPLGALSARKNLPLGRFLAKSGPEGPGTLSAKQTDEVVLPLSLTAIGESAFEGIAAEVVEITENVVSIGPRAFADCQNLREIHISATVQEIDGTALSGCQSVTVYGSTDVAKAFAEANCFTYIDGSAPSDPPTARENPPITLPFVPAH